jgi:uncharacterized protein
VRRLIALPEVESVTPQEEQLLNSLVERVKSTQLQEKDPDAESLLNQNLGSNPDSLYILAQTVLVQNIALEQAKAQVAQLQQQAQQAQQAPQPARSTSFLGSLLGHHDAPPPPPPTQPVYTPVPQQAYVPPPPPPPAYAQPQYAPVATGQPSFLRGAMQTAAGVAAGALAFEGVEAVVHGLAGIGHPGYEWGGGPGMGMGGFGMNPGMGMGAGFERPEETVINNYYDQPGGQDHNLHEASDQFADRGSADQGGAQFSDASYDTSNDQGGYDDSSSGGFDDSSGGGFDDGGGGGFDSGGGGGDVL